MRGHGTERVEEKRVFARLLKQRFGQCADAASIPDTASPTRQQRRSTFVDNEGVAAVLGELRAQQADNIFT